MKVNGTKDERSVMIMNDNMYVHLFNHKEKTVCVTNIKCMCFGVHDIVCLESRSAKELRKFWDFILATWTTRKPFFLRHTARLPSSTSQLVLFHHLFCIHFWGGSTSMFTGGGPLPCSLLGGSTSMFTSRGVHFHVHFGGVHFHVHFWGGVHFHVHFWGDPTYPIMLLIYCYRMLQCIMGKIRHGTPLHFHVHFWGGGGPLPCSHLGGIHFCVHFWGGVPCDLSHNALIYCYRMPQCIMGKIHMGPPPPPQLDRQTDRQTRLKTLPSRTLRMRAGKYLVCMLKTVISVASDFAVHQNVLCLI